MQPWCLVLLAMPAWKFRLADRTVADVTLLTNTQSLDAVVITALGISKQARGLGYSATNVKPDELDD